MTRSGPLVSEEMFTHAHGARFASALGLGAEHNPLIAWTLALPPPGELADDGTELRDPLIGTPPLPLRMQAGGECHFLSALKPGARLRRRSTLDTVRRVTGRGGAERVFVTITHELTADDALAVTDSQTIVYRAPGPAGTGVSRPGEPDWVETRRASITDLFRYSALTFNAYRIHYDREFCRSAGYPDVVVHGPLLATWLLAAAAPHLAGEVRRFHYRAVAPVYVNEPVRLCGRRQAGDMECWVERPDGQVALVASMADSGAARVEE